MLLEIANNKIESILNSEGFSNLTSEVTCNVLIVNLPTSDAHDLAVALMNHAGYGYVKCDGVQYNGIEDLYDNLYSKLF